MESLIETCLAQYYSQRLMHRTTERVISLFALEHRMDRENLKLSKAFNIDKSAIHEKMK